MTGARARFNRPSISLAVRKRPVTTRPHVKFNQLFDGKACGRSGSRLFFLRKEIATGPCGTGYRIGSFACVFETSIGDAAERDSSRSPSPNPIG